MSNEQVAPETKGVTVKLLGAVDLGPEIEGTDERSVVFDLYYPVHAQPRQAPKIRDEDKPPFLTQCSRMTSPSQFLYTKALNRRRTV